MIEIPGIDNPPQDLSKIWFTSDSHLGHVRILELGDGRPFSSIEEHDSALASHWSKVVQPDDLVIHLGDVVLGKWTSGLGIIKSLNGVKAVISGNHDRIFSKEKPHRREIGFEEYSKAFDFILDETIVITLDDVEFTVSHFPSSEVRISGEPDRYVDKRPEDVGRPIIHGHTHQLEKVTRTAKGTPQISVGVDANNWTPVNGTDILKTLEDMDS